MEDFYYSENKLKFLYINKWKILKILFFDILLYVNEKIY